MSTPTTEMIYTGAKIIALGEEPTAADRDKARRVLALTMRAADTREDALREASRQLLDATDNHAREICEPLHHVEREALRAALAQEPTDG